MHHMLEGWPCWENLNLDWKKLASLSEDEEKLKERKRKFWKLDSQIGYNISSLINDEGFEMLSKLGIKCVRIGAVGVGEKAFYEFCDFLTEPEDELERLSKVVGKLRKMGIVVVLTLDLRLASSEIWRLIAEKFAKIPNVVGYDLINEPFTEHESDLHWVEVESDDAVDQGMQKVVGSYIELVSSIRSVDKVTPIILEPTFWGQVDALKKFPLETLTQIDDNLLMSVHFYEPMKLTFRGRNKGRFSFPCAIPWYENVNCSEETLWNEEAILAKLKKAKIWAEEMGVTIFLGEFGISRDVGGAPEYLEAVIKAVKNLAMTGLLFSFRDPGWDAMDYEFGEKAGSFSRVHDQSENAFMKVIMDGVGN